LEIFQTTAYHSFLEAEKKAFFSPLPFSRVRRRKIAWLDIWTEKVGRKAIAA